MKTGRPDYHIPSPETVSRDVKNVFVCVRKRITNMLQVNGILDEAAKELLALAGDIALEEEQTRDVGKD